jgi:hypothetical protein
MKLVLYTMAASIVNQPTWVIRIRHILSMAVWAKNWKVVMDLLSIGVLPRRNNNHYEKNRNQADDKKVIEHPKHVGGEGFHDRLPATLQWKHFLTIRRKSEVSFCTVFNR